MTVRIQNKLVDNFEASANQMLYLVIQKKQHTGRSLRFYKKRLLHEVTFFLSIQRLLKIN